MGMALSLGRRGLGRVWPNPSVGCVIVKHGRVLGRGWTADCGRPHAEPRALNGIDATGATVYVTLEPCAHHGQTPPCANALIAAGVARIVVAIEDPDPRVAGKGIAMLRAAGITVEIGLREDEARKDLAGFLSRINHQTPFVTLKLASSFDGRIATATGESKWITGPAARRKVHAMRAQHDAVLVGSGTVRADDPSLTVRDLGISRQPVRVVASTKADFIGAGLIADLPDVPLWVCHGRDADAGHLLDWQSIGAKTIACDIVNGQLDPSDLLKKLAGEGLTRVFCEGGGSLAASFLSQCLVDEIVGFTAGVMLGADGTSSVGPIEVETLQDAARYRLLETSRIGNDIMHRWERL